MQHLINRMTQLLPGISTPKRKGFKGAFILKHPRKYPIDELAVGDMRKIETYKFGRNSVSIFIVAI